MSIPCHECGATTRDRSGSADRQLRCVRARRLVAAGWLHGREPLDRVLRGAERTKRRLDRLFLAAHHGDHATRLEVTRGELLNRSEVERTDLLGPLGQLRDVALVVDDSLERSCTARRAHWQR